MQDEKEIIRHAWEVQKGVNDSEEVLDPDNTSPAWITDLDTINDEFEHESLEEVVRLLNTNLIRQ